MNFKMIRLVVILGAAGAAWMFGDKDNTAQSGDPVVEFAAGHATMNAAQDEAQRLLPKFLDAALTDTGTSKPDTLVKVAFPIADSQSPDTGVEVIWVGPFTKTGSEFAGVLANEPVSMPGYRAGSTVEFSADMVRDWILPAGDGRAYGHYTTRVIAAQSDNEEFRQMLAQILMPAPAPEDW